MRGCVLPDAAFRVLRGLTALTRLELDGSYCVQAFENEEGEEIRQDPSVSDEGYMQAMQEIALGAIEHSSDQLGALVPALAALPRLQALHLTWDAAGGDTLRGLTQLRSLRELSLQMTFEDDARTAPALGAFPQPLRSYVVNGVERTAGGGGGGV